MTTSPAPLLSVLKPLLKAEWLAGILGLRLLVLCIAIATFMMAAVWMVGSGLSGVLNRGGVIFLGGDAAITTTNFQVQPATVELFDSLGDISTVAELRSSAQIGDIRVASEVKGVDTAYPLYGDVQLQSGRDFHGVMAGIGAPASALPPAIVEETLLIRTNGAVGDVMTIGTQQFEIVDVLQQEPDRLSAGRFMVGPRIIIREQDLTGSGLIQPGSLVEYRYRIRFTAEGTPDMQTLMQQAEPNGGWELEGPEDAGDRVLETVRRTTTFLGIAGIMALSIGLGGSWAATTAWINRRSRTISLYRLSGATADTVLALHGVIIALAGLVGVVLGLALAIWLTEAVMGLVTARLHVVWAFTDIVPPLLSVLVVLALGLLGTCFLALARVRNVNPGAAMRGGEAPMSTDTRLAGLALGLIAAAFAVSVLSLPVPFLAGLATVGLLAAIIVLAAVAYAMSWGVARLEARSFTSLIVKQNLGHAGQSMTRTVSIGVGIVGITAIVAAQASFTTALTGELPERIPDVILIDVQPAQVTALTEKIEADPSLGGLQAHPFMRMTIQAVNGVPAREALVMPEKSWVIEGDRSFSWTAEPTGAELLQGEWWPADYTGETLISPEEDVMEAFDLQVGDTMTYTVLGRTFTSRVANIRKEYHRTFRPEYLLMASPEPFRNAPHSWIMSLQGTAPLAVDRLIQDLSQEAPNVTSIDVRLIVEQLRGIVAAATTATLAIALTLVVAGGLSVAAMVAADVDSRRREALVYHVVGASRLEIAVTRLVEAGAAGLISAIVGTVAGYGLGYVIVTEGLRVAWAPGVMTYIIPICLGVLVSVIAGLAGGLGTAHAQRGQLMRQLMA